MKLNILVVVAHPDDEVLGCGGTIASHVASGDNVAVLILGEGKTSRIGKSQVTLKKELVLLGNETARAMKILGVTNFVMCDFPDNQFDTVPLLKLTQKIEEIKQKYKPSLIYTHHYGDMNIDHVLTHRAVLTASRPIPGEYVRAIYTFENPSSTEWNSYDHTNVFIPNHFVDIERYISAKTKAMACYQSELRPYPHPRSVKHLEELAKVNGAKIGLKFVENFMVIRQLYTHESLS